jgi:adsorption protein B
MDEMIILAMLWISMLINLSSIDDAFIDVLAAAISRRPIGTRSATPTAPVFGVFIANWHEEDVIGKMVEGNLARIKAPPVKFYLGVYPNDIGTLNVARKVESRHPDRVKVIVNTLAGPTSKGQLLNEMFRQVYSSAEAPDMAVLHDSEDIIDPRTFEIYGLYGSEYDFIQVPVFSLNSTNRSMTAATYMDEFAERHTREMVVRDALGAVIPSAGVGTCITARLIRHLLGERRTVLMTGCVTEDYILGVEAKRAGFRAAFAAVSADEYKGSDYVATREFFPKSIIASIKQKTRWVYGINFEATRKLGWRGDIWDRYFFFRDRKGAVTNFLPPISLVLLLFFLLRAPDFNISVPEISGLLNISVALNVGFLVLRYVIRVKACHDVYGSWQWVGVALRWPVALYVNTAAAWRAWKTYLGDSAFATKPIVWSKTEHEVPEDFFSAKR